MNLLLLGSILLQVQLSSIDGIVTKPGSNEPLGRATVTLNSTTAGSAALSRAAVTEEDGRFAIRDVVPGDYQLTVENARYGRMAYGQRRPDGPGSVLSVAAGERISDLRVSMIATGAISGRITGRNGEPAVNAAVQALKQAYQDGRRVWQPAQTATTDDQGEYRLFWLPAGQYVVAAALEDFELPVELNSPIPPGRNAAPQATVRPSLVSTAESLLKGTVVTRILDDGSLQEESWLPVFYPAATEAQFAVPIDLLAGATMTGVNISIEPAPVQRVRGRVIGGNPGGSTQVMLLPQNSPVGIRAGKAGDGTDGSFEFSGLRPGSYNLFARDSRSGLVSAAIPVEVAGRNIDGLEITLIPGTQIGVVIRLDNPSEDSSGPQPLAGIGARLIPDIPTLDEPETNGQSQPGTGRTAFRNVPPGNYQVSIGPRGESAPAGGRRFHVKSVRFGNQEASDGIQVTDASPAPLEILLTSESGSVEGTVSGAGQLDASGATVVLVPATGRKRAELYKSAVTNGAGRFRLEDIAPGDYTLFAWDDVETGAWQNSDFMRLHETKGQPVHVSGNSSQDVTLTIIHNP